MIRVEPNHANVPKDRWQIDSRTSKKTFNVKCPTLNVESKVVSIGSCFAFEVSKALKSKGLKVNENDLFFYSDLITTTAALVEHFEWCTSKEELPPAFSFRDYKDALEKHERNNPLKRFDDVKELSDIKNNARQSIVDCDLAIMTLGLSEVWCDPVTNKSMLKWPGKNASKSLQFKILTAEENCENIKRIVKLIRDINPNCSIVFSLSPIPLLATFRTDYNINICNISSKSRLKAGLDQFFYQNQDDKIYYWPSYEYIIQLQDPWREEEGRHVKYEIVDEVMSTFLLKTGLI